VRDDQARRYARHILVPDIGGVGQSALLAATASLDLGTSPDAAIIAAQFLAAGGVGRLVIVGATAAQRAQLAAYGPDTLIEASGDGIEVTLPARPPWWPAADGDGLALAYWRGSMAATRWMAASIAHARDA
jgi:hypothetical protein